jgi:hypothetical protein
LRVGLHAMTSPIITMPNMYINGRLTLDA